jgi:hypothetical protein
MQIEENERKKKQALNEEMKKALDKQIEEKKRNIHLKREEDRNYINKVKQVEDAYFLDKENKVRIEREKKQNYGAELKKQEQEKKQKNKTFMDDIERNLNKEIMNDIYTKI